jgi:hypothetical protein
MIKTPKARLKKLQKYLQEKEDISWDYYLQRFEGTKPVEIWPTNYPISWEPTLVESEVELLGNLNNGYRAQRFELPCKIIVGFPKKIKQETIQDEPYLRVNAVGLYDLIHKDIIDKMLEICPDDFQPVPVKVIGTTKNDENFEFNHYYTINVLNRIKAIDETRSEFRISENGIAHFQKFKYKENPWQDGFVKGVSVGTSEEMYPSRKLEKPCMIAIDALSGAIVWHPRVAKLFSAGSFYWFIQDIEQHRHY